MRSPYSGIPSGRTGLAGLRYVNEPSTATSTICSVVCGALLWALLSALCVGQAFADLNPSEALHLFIHQTWTTAQGLPQNSVLAIAQTSDGYLWLGTEEGLVRFDGASFTVFDKHTSGLNDNIIQALLVDRDQNVWIGTTSGVSRFKNGRFTAYALKAGLSSNSVQCLYQDEQGVLWIGTDGGGLIRMKNGLFRVFTKTDGLADNAVLAITGDNHGTVWVGTHGGLSRLKNGRFLNYGVQQGLGSENVRDLRVGHGGELWIATNDGLSRMAPSGEMSRFTAKDGLPNNFVNRLYVDRAGALWVGTLRGGLCRYVNDRFDRFDDKSEPITGDIFSIFEDHEGSVWIGTAGSGLNSLRAGSFTTLTKQDGLTSNSVLGLYQDDEQNFWIGSDKGLMRMHGSSVESYSTQNGLPDNLVFSVTKDHEGSVWVGTQKGLARIDKGKVKTYGPADGMAIVAVLCTLTDQRGTVWAGSRGGLSRFTGNGFVQYTTRDGLSNNLVLSIYEDQDGSLWIGTAGGLNQFKNGKFRTYTTRDGLSSDRILSILGEKDGTLWLGTSGGINRFRNGKFVSITSDKGLHDDVVLNIVDDHLGRFWMSSNKGIFSITEKQLNDFADGLVGRVTPTVYGISDGLKSRECNGGFQPSAWRSKDGRIYFPTPEGLSFVDPAHLAKAEVPAQAIVERVVADNKNVDPSKPVVIPPGKGQLEFQFTSPTFTAPQKLQFRYMLEGFDKDWTSAGGRRVAYYTNIPHGDYKFEVRAGLDGEWGPVSRTVTLTLKPHFYQTATFNIALLLFALGVAAGTYRLRVNQLKIREKKLVSLVNERTSALQESERLLRRSRDELEVRVRERTMELVNSNKALEEEITVRRQTEEQLILAKDAAESASRAKSDFLANMSHEIRTPINGILGMTDVALSTGLDDEQREYLEIVKFSADSLLGIVNDILDFSKIEARKLALDRTHFDIRAAINELIRSLQMRVRQKGLYLNSDVADDVPDILVGDPLRVRQVLLNLLDNAVKFTSVGGVSLTVTQENCLQGKCTLHFAVKDTGIGIPANKQKTIFEAFSQADTSSTRRFGGTGLGLTISYQLALMMDGSLWVESTPGEGSTFHFTAAIEVMPTAPQPNDGPSTAEKAIDPVGA